MKKMEAFYIGMFIICYRAFSTKMNAGTWEARRKWYLISMSLDRDEGTRLGKGPHSRYGAASATCGCAVTNKHSSFCAMRQRELNLEHENCPGYKWRRVAVSKVRSAKHGLPYNSKYIFTKAPIERSRRENRRS